MGGVIFRLGILPEPWESENTSEDLAPFLGCSSSSNSSRSSSSIGSSSSK